MAVKIRLKRMGTEKGSFFIELSLLIPDPQEMAVSSKKSELVDPSAEPSAVKVNDELAQKWLSNGAQPTETVAKLFKNAGITK